MRFLLLVARHADIPLRSIASIPTVFAVERLETQTAVRPSERRERALLERHVISRNERLVVAHL
jgi:hypothetical protein